MSKLKKKIFICDVIDDIEDLGGYDHILLWKSYDQNIAQNIVSIPRSIEENSDKLKEQYLSFIYNLGEASVDGKKAVEHLELSSNFSCWWMTLLTEKCNFAKSPQIDNVIKIMSFKDWLKNDVHYDIKLFSSDYQLNLAINAISILRKYNYEWIKVKSNNLSAIKKIYEKIPYVIRAFIWLVRYLINNWQLKGVGVEKWKVTGAKVSFISYFFNLDTAKSNNLTFKSRYWTKLPKIISQKGIKSNWLHIYVPSAAFPKSNKAKRVVNGFNDKDVDGQIHVFLQSFISLSVVIKSIYAWFGIIKKYRLIKVAIQNESGELWWLIKSDLKDSILGVTAINNLLFYKLFCESMKLLPPQNKGFYLQENQGWESGFIHAWNISGHSKNIIGMPHSTLSYWDLRFYFDKRTYDREVKFPKPLPNNVAVNGNNTRNKYLSWGYPKADIIEVEALRYLNIVKNKYLDLNKKAPKFFDNITVLVLGDYMKVNTDKIMKLVQKSDQLLNIKTNYVVKPHPMCPIDENDYPELDIKVTNKPINDILDDCDIAITSMSSSASVDVYITGKPVVIFLDQSSLKVSPLMEEDGIVFVSSENEFADFISGENWYGTEGCRLNDYFFLDENLPKWLRLLADVDSKNLNNLGKAR